MGGWVRDLRVHSIQAGGDRSTGKSEVCGARSSVRCACDFGEWWHLVASDSSRCQKTDGQHSHRVPSEDNTLPGLCSFLALGEGTQHFSALIEFGNFVNPDSGTRNKAADKRGSAIMEC